MPRFHLDKVEDLAGFMVKNAKPGDVVPVLVRARLTSDDSDFYGYMEHISRTFLSSPSVSVPADGVHQLLVIIHSDLSADVHVNDLAVEVEINAKRPIKGGELARYEDIADIRRVKFSEIRIKDSDRIIYCFKVGWRFGLFFDLSIPPRSTGTIPASPGGNLDLEKVEGAIGDLRRYLSFYHVYKVLESDSQFEEMLKRGWFPFVEILATEHELLSQAFRDSFDLDNRVKTVVERFSEKRVKIITEKWWGNAIFAEKRPLIEAGIRAYLQNTQDGFINCIKNLWTEIEGILRRLYYTDEGKGDGVKTSHLVDHIVNKAIGKAGSADSLFFPLQFLKYLQDVVFPNFNVETGEISMSRNTSSHGVADVGMYTQERALQLILILDQIYFYS